MTHADCSRHDTGWGHPEHQGRLPAVARAVHRDMLTLFDHLVEVEGEHASVDDLRVAHSTAYIERVKARCQEALAAATVVRLEGDVVVSGASWDALLAAVGCVLTAVDRVLAGEVDNAFCAVRPPGHGAGREGPGRFGIFNSVAIAALRLLRSAPERRVLVVEWGSSPGVGTANILSGEKRARFVSVHLSGAGDSGPIDGISEASSSAVPAGSGLPEMLGALRGALDEAERGFTPDLILLSLGCDALAGDPLGGLALSPGDYHDLTNELRARAERLCAGRLVSVLEEGYEAGEMARSVVQHIRALAALPPLDG